MAKVLTTVMLLAATMQGETQVLDSDDAALSVFEVAWNRKIALGIDIRSAIIEGFYGWKSVEDVDPRYVRLACRAMTEHRWTHNALYMLSVQDLEALGGVAYPSVKHYSREDWAVYLFEEWPRRGGE